MGGRCIASIAPPSEAVTKATTTRGGGDELPAGSVSKGGVEISVPAHRASDHSQPFYRHLIDSLACVGCLYRTLVHATFRLPATRPTALLGPKPPVGPATTPSAAAFTHLAAL